MAQGHMIDRYLDLIDRYLDLVPDWVTNFFAKVILVALIAMGIKLAIQMKNEKVTVFNIILSLIIGVGTAALCGGLVLENCRPVWVPIVIAVITILGEKVGYWLIYKLKVDTLMEDFLDYLRKKSGK